MAKLTADQIRNRERAETLIRLMAPALNLLLALGDRFSRIIEPDDSDYYPARVEGGERPRVGDGRASAGD